MAVARKAVALVRWLVVLEIGIWRSLFLSTRVFRHLVDDAGLRIRQGTRADIQIPWDAIESLISRRGSAPTNKAVQVDDNAVAYVPVLKQTNVAAVLRRPISIGTHDVTTVCFYVDDRPTFVATARNHLTASPPAGR